MILLLASLLMTAGAADAIQSSILPSDADRAGFEDELKFSAEGEMLRAIERYYPAEYRVLIDGIYAAGARLPANAPARAATRKRMLGAFYKRRVAGLANAPAPLLNEINARQLALIRRLAREDPRLCAEFATTLFIGGSDLPSSYESEASVLLAAIVEAAKAGEAAPPDPRRKGLADEDAGPFYAQLLQIEPSGQIQAALAADAGDAGGTPEMQCRVGTAVIASIDKMLPEQAANVAAYFLTQTLSGDESGPEPRP